MSNSTCLRADLGNSNIGSVNKDGGLNEVAYSQPKATQKHHPFRASGYLRSKHEGTNMTCKPNFAPGGTLSKTRLASCCSGGILAGATGEYWRALAGYSAGPSGMLGGIQWDTWRDPLAGCSGGILGGIHGQATLEGYLAGSTGGLLWWDLAVSMASRSGGILGGMHWRAALAGYSAGSTDKCSGGILGGIRWRAALAGYWVGAWCRSIANADSNIKSNNPFLSGGKKEKERKERRERERDKKRERERQRESPSACRPRRLCWYKVLAQDLLLETEVPQLLEALERSLQEDLFKGPARTSFTGSSRRICIEAPVQDLLT